MDSYTFEDVLTGSTVSFDWPGLNGLMVRGPQAGAADELSAGAAGAGGASAPAQAPCESIFFPGCSFINYAMPLVQSVYDLLAGAGTVQGMSLLCCGKILSYEPDGAAVRAAFEADLREHIVAAGVKRIVAACPNCVKALRAAFAADERTEAVEVLALPAVLAELGYRIDAESAQQMLFDELTEGFVAYEVAQAGVPEAGDLRFSVHDSCPDRESGEFADGVRALLPEGIVNEMGAIRKRSSCCGSLIRATGKWEAADKQANRRAEQAREAGAQGLVTVCVSCAFQFSMAEHTVPAFHYLELLFNWRVNWAFMDAWMKLRFLFDESLGVTEATEDERRAFVGLGAADEAEE